MIKEDLGQIDLVIYSLASPVRTHPTTGKRFKSVLKPIGGVFSNKTVDFHTGNVSEISIDPAAGEDVENTVTVMGGEDWKMWMDALKAENLLSDGATQLRIHTLVQRLPNRYTEMVLLEQQKII